jgi:pimeloyl-ACP methyl ester carboxylesterase
MNAFFYLHGWASSPASSKACFFQQCFANLAIPLPIPDLNQDDFYHLTLTRQIHQVIELFPPDTEITLIGSSLGGLVALWVAQQNLQVKQLVLMAPALDFVRNNRRVIGDENLQQWQATGELSLYHYALQQETLLSYEFMRDMEHYEDQHLQRALPTLILHGIRDKVVPVEISREFAATHPWVTLQTFDSDHSLSNVQPELWQAIQQFCHLHEE